MSFVDLEKPEEIGLSNSLTQDLDEAKEHLDLMD